MAIWPDDPSTEQVRAILYTDDIQGVPNSSLQPKGGGRGGPNKQKIVWGEVIHMTALREMAQKSSLEHVWQVLVPKFFFGNVRFYSFTIIF